MIDLAKRLRSWPALALATGLVACTPNLTKPPGVRTPAQRTKACEQGHADACLELAIAHAAGIDVERDPAAMLTFERRSCELDNAKACYFLSISLEESDDPESAPELIASWDKSCSLGLAEACSTLPNATRTGDHKLPKDTDLAASYFAKACTAGHVAMCGPVDPWLQGDAPQSGMDKDDIRTVVRAHIEDVRTCYNRGLNHDGELKGRVDVHFMIGRKGIVSEASVPSRSLPGAVGRYVEICITAAVKRWVFPMPPGGGNAIVTYPFVLTPG